MSLNRDNQTDATNDVRTMQNLLKDFGFDKKFDGIPMHYFNKLWFKPFLNAAGQISVDGFYSESKAWNRFGFGLTG